MQPIVTDTADFPTLRTRNGIYVDKTAWMHRLVTDQNRRLFFLARPRRFGKSLTVSALDCLFQGRRDLFRGLAIDSLPWDWKPVPVLRFRFGDVTCTDLPAFRRSFAFSVRNTVEQAGMVYRARETPGDNFNSALKSLMAKHGPVAVLIDEYDAPVAHTIHNPDLAEAIRDHMAAFYAQMKMNDECVRFLFMTGVSKFSKLSVFSALSNLNDISFEAAYAGMFGYTEEELSANFAEHLREHARILGLSDGAYRDKLKWWYNGYRFSGDQPPEQSVYNPVSIALTLANKERRFRATWSSTGKASTLMNYLRRGETVAVDPNGLTGADESDFDVSDLRSLKPIGMLYQTGYLTIKAYDSDTGLYSLGVPDEEVRRDLAMVTTAAAAGQDTAWAAELGKNLRLARWSPFFEGLASLYAHMPWGSTESSPHESMFARCLCFLLASQGMRWRAEDVQADGRCDIVAEDPVGTFLFELKVDDTAESALSQIKTKGYDAPYRAGGKPIWAVGLAFDRSTRTMVGHAVERIV